MGFLTTLKVKKAYYAFFSILLSAVLFACMLPAGVTITSPDNDSSFRSGDGIRFRASAVAGEGSISEIRWTSSLDGLLSDYVPEAPGTRMETGFSLSSLSAGFHTVYCAACGTEGFVGLDSVSFTIDGQTGQEELFVLLAYPREGDAFQEGQEIVFAGAASDPADGGISGVGLSWSSSLDGDLGQGSPVTSNTLTAGTHTITLTAVNSAGETASVSVSISVTPAQETTTTTAPEELTTTSLSDDSSSTTSAPDASTSSTTTAAPGGTTTTASQQGETTTTTSLDADGYCDPGEIVCIDPDYSTEQYWCCEDYAVCGKVELVDGVYQGTCIYDQEATTTTAASSSTTTIQETPDKTTLYLSPESGSELLFYVVQPGGETVYYYGSMENDAMQLSHVAFDDGSAIIFSNDLMPIQWIADDLSVVVLFDPNNGSFDPENARHDIADADSETAGGYSTYTVNMYPENLSAIITAMESKTGDSYSIASEFLSNFSVSDYSDILSAATPAGEEQARYIAAAVGFSTAAAYLALDDAQSASAIKRRFSAQGHLDPLIHLVVGLIGNIISDAFGPQPPTDPSDPGVEVQLCRGQSSISQICHYMFFKPSYPGSAGPCNDRCFPSMKCLTICIPMTLSTESAEEFKGHFYNP